MPLCSKIRVHICRARCSISKSYSNMSSRKKSVGSFLIGWARQENMQRYRCESSSMLVGNRILRGERDRRRGREKKEGLNKEEEGILKEGEVRK